MTEDCTLSAKLLLDDDDDDDGDDGDGDGDDASPSLHASPALECMLCANASQHPYDGFCCHLYFTDGETRGTEK